MTKNLDTDGLCSIAHRYDLFYIDLWGVVHNGIKLYEGAIGTLKELKRNNKDFVLLTNAPRPNDTVKKIFRENGDGRRAKRSCFYFRWGSLKLLKKIILIKKIFSHRPSKRFWLI